MTRSSKPTLFLMEQVIVILIFAACAAVCVSIFVNSFIVASEASDINNAVLAAESAAECFKSTGGDVSSAASIIGGGQEIQRGDSAIALFYDKEWQISGENGAKYVMLMSVNETNNLPILCDIIVKTTEGKDVFAITAAVGRDGRE